MKKTIQKKIQEAMERTQKRGNPAPHKEDVDYPWEQPGYPQYDKKTGKPLERKDDPENLK